MTAKEKANQLVDKYFWSTCRTIDHAKKCALIAVDEIINALLYPPKPNENRQVVHSETLKFWELIKSEIEKL